MNWTVLVDGFKLLDENILLKQIVIVGAYAVAAKVADLFIDKVLKRLTAKTAISFDDQLIVLLHGPLCWTVFLLGIQHALVLRPMAMPWQTVLPAGFKTLILLIWSTAVIRLVNRLAQQNLTKVLTRGKIGRDLSLLLKNIIRVVVVASALLWLLSIWQVDLTPLFASAGIAGIAVALAAKDTLANFFGGISIFADNTFKIGDYIVLDSGERGEVVEIGIRSTRIKTRDDILITIPNSILANSKIINESAPLPRFRMRVPVSVAYGSDLTAVEEVLLSVAEGNTNIVRDPAPRVRLRKFGESSVDFELLCWADDPSQRGLEIHNLLKEISRTFSERRITIPFPQRDVHLDASQPIRFEYVGKGPPGDSD
jgi:small-conductance mechanosensitive channel